MVVVPSTTLLSLSVIYMLYWGGQTADRLVEGGYGKVLETHWLPTRTTGVSPLQMDTQVGSQVGKEGGGLTGLSGKSVTSCLCCYVVKYNPEKIRNLGKVLCLQA